MSNLVTEEKPIFPNRVCPKCGVQMEYNIEVEKDMAIILHYIWKCPKCGYIHTEEVY